MKDVDGKIGNACFEFCIGPISLTLVIPIVSLSKFVSGVLVREGYGRMV